MNFIQKLLGKKGSEENTGGMQDYMTLVRVYFQASIAANVGISNLAMVPDLRVFKSSFHVPTVNNKLGIGEKKYCQKMMQEIYGVNDNFFKEIDQSIRKNCRKMQDVQIYLLQFQNFLLLFLQLPHLICQLPVACHNRTAVAKCAQILARIKAEARCISK